MVRVDSLPAHAQSKTTDSFNFDEIGVAGKGSYNLTSEDETHFRKSML